MGECRRVPHIFKGCFRPMNACWGVGLRMADGSGAPMQQFREMTDSSGTGMVGGDRGGPGGSGGGACREEDCLLGRFGAAEWVVAPCLDRGGIAAGFHMRTRTLFESRPDLDPPTTSIMIDYISVVSHLFPVTWAHLKNVAPWGPP